MNDLGQIQPEMYHFFDEDWTLNSDYKHCRHVPRHRCLSTVYIKDYISPRKEIKHNHEIFTFRKHTWYNEQDYYLCLYCIFVRHVKATRIGSTKTLQDIQLKLVICTSSLITSCLFFACSKLFALQWSPYVKYAEIHRVQILYLFKPEIPT